MSDVPPSIIRNETLFLQCNKFLQRALAILKPVCGRDLIEFIESKPTALQYYTLLNPNPSFYPLLFRLRGSLEELEEFQQCSAMMHRDPVISRHLDVTIGSTTIGARIGIRNGRYFILLATITSPLQLILNFLNFHPLVLTTISRLN